MGCSLRRPPPLARRCPHPVRPDSAPGCEAGGLIRGGAAVDLTAEGQALHGSLREYIAGPTVRLLSQFDIHDIETTVATMKAITKLATA